MPREAEQQTLARAWEMECKSTTGYREQEKPLTSNWWAIVYVCMLGGYCCHVCFRLPDVTDASCPTYLAVAVPDTLGSQLALSESCMCCMA